MPPRRVTRAAVSLPRVDDWTYDAQEEGGAWSASRYAWPAPFRCQRSKGAHVTDEEPISYQVLATGTDVRTVDGTSIGTVAHVLQEPELDLFDGIAIATHHGLRFVDRDQITSITTRAVTTTLSSADAANLPEPEGEPVFHVDALHDVGPALTARLGRMFRREHWISGS